MLKKCLNYFKKRDEMGRVANYVAGYIDTQVHKNLGYVLIASQEQLHKLIKSRANGLSDKEINFIIRKSLGMALYNMRVNYALEKKALYLKLKKGN